MMQFTVSEWHQVTSNKIYDWDEDMIIEEFGSVERLREIISWQEQQAFGGMDPEGEEPTDEESERFWELTWETDYDREDDWWTDRKGGYEVTVKVDE